MVVPTPPFPSDLTAEEEGGLGPTTRPVLHAACVISSRVSTRVRDRRCDRRRAEGRSSNINDTLIDA